MQIRENRCYVCGRTEVLCGYPSKSVLDTLMVLETDVPARRELQKSSREPTIGAAMVLEASVVREAQM